MEERIPPIINVIRVPLCKSGTPGPGRPYIPIVYVTYGTYDTHEEARSPTCL